MDRVISRSGKTGALSAGRVYPSLPLVVLPVLLSVGSGPAVAEAQQGTDAHGSLGVQVYEASCIVCHKADGKGVPELFPPLQGSEMVEGPREPLLSMVLRGRAAMPGFGERLTDEEIAAVLSYVRASWGNEAGPVSPRAVTSARERWAGDSSDGGG